MSQRNPEVVKQALGDNDHLLVLPLDVIDEAQTAAAVDAVLKEFGQIDVLVNNAGRGLVGAIEETSIPEVRSIFAMNVEGILNVSRSVLPSMRAGRSGRILNMSSVGGFVSWPGWGIYCSTKFAVEGISEAMHAELRPLGISVTLIEPGPFRTDFLDASSLVRTEAIIEDYSASSGAARQWADNSHNAQAGEFDRFRKRRFLAVTTLSDCFFQATFGCYRRRPKNTESEQRGRTSTDL